MFAFSLDGTRITCTQRYILIHVHLFHTNHLKISANWMTMSVQNQSSALLCPVAKHNLVHSIQQTFVPFIHQFTHLSIHFASRIVSHFDLEFQAVISIKHCEMRPKNYSFNQNAKRVHGNLIKKLTTKIVTLSTL